MKVLAFAGSTRQGSYALSRAASVFDEQARLVEEQARKRVGTVIDQALWAAGRLQQS